MSIIYRWRHQQGLLDSCVQTRSHNAYAGVTREATKYSTEAPPAGAVCDSALEQYTGGLVCLL
jgi:hypothetical protein